MTRRVFAALVWFATVWFGAEIVWSLAGIPREVGPILAAGAAAFVGIDPMAKIWGNVSKSESLVRPRWSTATDHEG